MDTEQILRRMLSNTYTKTDCYRRLALLQDFLDSALFGGTTPQKSFMEMLAERYGASEEKAPAEAVAQWGEEVRAAFSAEQVSEEMRALKDRIETLPELVLYVPVALEEPHLQALGQWCRAQVHPEVLLEVHVDPATAGGCALVWNSVFRDFSLQYFMDKHREELLQSLGRGMPNEDLQARATNAQEAHAPKPTPPTAIPNTASERSANRVSVS